MAGTPTTLNNQQVDDLVAQNTGGDQPKSFSEQMFGVSDPSQVLQTLPDDQQTTPDRVRYRFAGDGKTYLARKDQTPEDVLQRIWDHKTPGLWGSLKATGYYGIPSDFSSALSYALGGMGFDESSQEWRDYTNKTRESFQKEYGQYMVPSAQAAWDQGKVVDYALQTLGSGLPYVGMALAGGLAGDAAVGAAAGAGYLGADAAATQGAFTAARAAGQAATTPTANMAGAFLGSTAITAPVTVAQFADRQVANMREQGVPDPEKNIDWAKALGYGTLAAGAQSLPIETILFGGPILGAIKGMGVDLGTSTSARILAHTADVAGTNAMINMGTSVLSRAQADMPLLNDQAKADYFDAMIAGGVVGIPFGLGKGIIHPHASGLLPERKGKPEDIDSVLASNAAGTEVKLPEGMPTAKTDYVFFDPKATYGINDPAQAQEFLQSIRMKDGSTAFDALKSTRRYGPNFTDEQILSDARRLAFIHGRQDLVRGNSQGILFNDAEEVPQRHSNDPRVLTRAAFLTDKAGYPDAQVRYMTDDIVNKLYETHIKRATDSMDAPKSQKEAMLKYGLENVDDKIVKDAKEFGSLTKRPEAVERINKQVENNRKILSKDARQNLARELMNKTAKPEEPLVVRGLTHNPLMREPTPEELAMEGEGGGSRSTRSEPYVNPRNDPEAIAQAQAMGNEGGPAPKEGVFGQTDPKQVVDELHKPESKIDKKAFATWLNKQPFFKKLAGEEPAKKVINRANRLQKEKPVKENTKGQFRYQDKTDTADDSEPLPRDVLREQADLLDQYARRTERNIDRIEKEHPGFGKALDDLFKAISENIPRTNILDDGKKSSDTTTKAVKATSFFDQLNKRARVVDALQGAFKTVSDKAGNLMSDLFSRLAGGSELSVRDLTTLTSGLRLALNPKELEPHLVESFYKRIRDTLPLKHQKRLNEDQSVMEKWYKNEFGMNPKDTKGFTAPDVEAAAFSMWIRGDHSVAGYKDFRNSKHEQLFRQIATALGRVKKELNDQGLKRFDDVLTANVSSNEAVPPGARPRVAQGIADEHSEGELRKDLEQTAKDFNEKRDQDKGVDTSDKKLEDNLSTTPDDGILGGLKNNMGTSMFTLSKLMSMPALGRLYPAFGELTESVARRLSQSGRYQTRMATLVHSVYTKHGADNFYKAADTLAYLRKSDQLLQDNGQGQFKIKDSKGNEVTLTREFSNMLKDVNGVYKEAPRIAVEVYRKKLDQFDAEGLNQASSMEAIKRGINKLTEGIEGNYIDEQRSHLVARRQALQNIHDRLDEALKIMDESKPYVPFLRFGDYMVQVVDRTTKDENGQHATVHFEPMNDYNLFGWKTKLPSEREVRQWIASKGLDKKYGDKSRYDIRHFQMTYHNATTFINKNLVTHELVQSLIASGLDRNLELADLLANNGVNTEKAIQDHLDAIKGTVRKSTVNLDRLLSSGGMGRFAVESRNIEGHSTDWGRATEAYVNIFAHGLGRVESAPEWSRLISAIETEQNIPPKVRQSLRDYVNYISSPSKDYATLRAFNYIWAMGLRPSAALLQLPTLLQQVPGLMLQYSPSVGNFLTLSRNMMRGLAKNRLLGKAGVGQYPKEILDKMEEHKPFFRLNYQQDALIDIGYRGRPAERGMNAAVNAAGWMLAKAEAYTREVSFASFYEMLGNQNVLDKALKQRENDHLWQAFYRNNKDIMDLRTAMSIYSVQETHGVFGKVGRGPLQRGLSGSLFFPFTTYGQQMLEVMTEQLSGHRGLPGILGGTWVLGSYMALAGMAGIPAWDLWKTVAEQYSLRVNNKQLDVEMWLKEHGMPLWARKGLLSTATGTDLSSRLSQNVIADQLAQGLIKGDVKFQDLFGVPGRAATGLWEGLTEAFNPLSTKTPVEAISAALPTFMQDAIKAEQMMEGTPRETKTGKTLGTPTGYDTAAQALGFSPLSQAVAREKIYWEGKVNSEFTQFKTRLAEGLAEAEFISRQGDATRGEEMKRQMSQELLRYARANQMVITPDFWSGINKAVQQRLIQKLKPGVNLKPTNQQLAHVRAFTPE